MSHFPNPNSKNGDEGSEHSPPMSARSVRSDSSSSSSGSRTPFGQGLKAEDLKTTAFQSEPVYRSVDLLPPSLSRAADVDFGFQDFRLKGPSEAIRDLSSSPSSAPNSEIFDMLPTVDPHNLNIMPKVTYTTTATSSLITAEKILNVLKTRSITFEIKRKSHSSSPSIKAQAYSPCCTRNCEINITMYANELGDTIVEIVRYSGCCVLYRSVANELFSVVETSSEVTSEAPHIPDSLCCESEADDIQVPPPPLSKSLASHTDDANPLYWLTTLAVATDTTLTTASAAAENAKDVMESSLFGALLHVSKTDSNDAKIVALAVLRNVVGNAKDIKTYVSALPNINELLAGLLSNAQTPTNNLTIAYLSVSIVSGLLAAAPRTVGKELKSLGADKVFEKCRGVGQDKHFQLAEAAIDAATAFQIHSR